MSMTARDTWAMPPNMPIIPMITDEAGGDGMPGKTL
jgi:hypothetical protein